MNNIQRAYEDLLRGKPFPFPGGKVARPTSKPRACPTCSGSKTVVEEMPAASRWRYEESPCGTCWSTGKVVDFVIEDDPTVLRPWTGAEYTEGGGFAERHRADGQRVAYIDNDQGDISIGIEPSGGRSYTIRLEAQYDDDLLPKRRSGDESEALTWAIALRLADAELVNLKRGT